MTVEYSVSPMQYWGTLQKIRLIYLRTVIKKQKCTNGFFFEQYSHEPYIAVARFIQKYQGMPEHRLEDFAHEIAETKVNQVMEAAMKHQHPLQCTMEKE